MPKARNEHVVFKGLKQLQTLVSSIYLCQFVCLLSYMNETSEGKGESAAQNTTIFKV